MSAIDVYKHKVLGAIECPSNYNLVFESDTKYITIYQILEDVPDVEDSFDGKVGDILVGGGRGEAPALRISNPLAFQFFTLDAQALPKLEFGHRSEVFQAFWKPRESYIIGEGFSKVGWTPEYELDMWLAENVCLLLISEFLEFKSYRMHHAESSRKLTLIRDIL